MKPRKMRATPGRKRQAPDIVRRMSPPFGLAQLRHRVGSIAKNATDAEAPVRFGEAETIWTPNSL
jgi:hypothetical protein